ncbi:hypothetical protein ASF22_20580 [Methylobacterium sp. Leaf87]|nr:hypothetical protein ASF22_20580 [Methylobacterium sp. Leaf87]
MPSPSRGTATTTRLMLMLHNAFHRVKDVNDAWEYSCLKRNVEADVYVAARHVLRRGEHRVPGLCITHKFRDNILPEATGPIIFLHYDETTGSADTCVDSFPVARNNRTKIDDLDAYVLE